MRYRTHPRQPKQAEMMHGTVLLGLYHFRRVSDHRANKTPAWDLGELMSLRGCFQTVTIFRIKLIGISCITKPFPENAQENVGLHLLDATSSNQDECSLNVHFYLLILYPVLPSKGAQSSNPTSIITIKTFTSSNILSPKNHWSYGLLQVWGTVVL